MGVELRVLCIGKILPTQATPQPKRESFKYTTEVHAEEVALWGLGGMRNTNQDSHEPIKF
jgi:hypothetical protein